MMMFDVDGRGAKIIDTTIEPVRNLVTRMEHRARNELQLGKQFSNAEVASGTANSTGVASLAWQTTTRISSITSFHQWFRRLGYPFEAEKPQKAPPQRRLIL